MKKSAQIVTPWEVDAGDDAIDYELLVRNFGSKLIDEVLHFSKYSHY